MAITEVSFSFLPNILIFLSFLIVAVLFSFIPRYGRFISYSANILGHLLFIGGLYSIRENMQSDIFSLSANNIQLIKLIGISNCVILFLNGYYSLQNVRSLLIFGFVYLASILLISASDFVTFYISLEVLSILTYSTIVFSGCKYSKESSVKIYIQNLIISAIFLLGVAFFYGSTGSLGPEDIDVKNQYLFILSLSFLFIAACFKLGVFPFHSWIESIYSNVDGGHSAIVLIVNKLVLTYVFITLLQKLILECDPHYQKMFVQGATLLAIFSSFYGNMMALVQKYLKKIIVYSTLAHSGHILMLLCIGPGEDFEKQLMFCLAFYSLSVIGAFLAINSLVYKGGDHYDALKGAFYRNKFGAIYLVVFILSLAGFPLTIGLYVKYLLFSNYFLEGYLVEGLIILSSTIISFIYYGKIILTLFRESLPGRSSVPIEENLRTNFVQLILAAIIVLGGIWPSLFLK